MCLALHFNSHFYHSLLLSIRLTDLRDWIHQSHNLDQAEQYLVAVKEEIGRLYVPTSDAQLILTACDMVNDIFLSFTMAPLYFIPPPPPFMLTGG